MSSSQTAQLHAALSKNQIWPLHDSDVPVLVKVYSAPTWSPFQWARIVLEGIGRQKTSSRAGARWRTERDVLRVWSQAGFDVPADLTERHPVHPGRPYAVLERVHGRLLGMLLCSGKMGEADRLQAVGRYAAEMGRRHRLAIERGEHRLVHEHPSLQHVIVSGPRLVTIDFEQAFRPVRDVRVLVAHEVVAALRSLGKGADAARFATDLAAFVEGYGSRDGLAACAREYLRSPSPRRRLLWALDRRLRRDRKRGLGKYQVAALLADAVA